MKKTLVALAAFTAVAAFAQSSVSIIGVLDVGYRGVKHTDSARNTGGVFNNGVATSQFDFVGTEDLGGGLKSGFFFELDVNPPMSSTLNQASGGSTVYTGTPFTGEQYLNIDGGFGSIKVGTPNSIGLNLGVMAQPFGTALGSGYSAGFGRLGTAAASGINQYVGGPNSGGRIIRHEKAIRYDTPNFMGVTGTFEYSAKNDNSATPTSNNNGFQALGVRYANGPLNLGYAQLKADAGSNQAAGSMTTWGTAVPNTLAANNAVKYSLLSANYTIGATTLYYGSTSTKDDTGLVEDSKSSNIAVKHVMGQVDLLANLLTRTSGLASQSAAVGYNPNGKVTGLGANYNISKLTSLYYRYEKLSGLNYSATAADQSQKINALGLVIKF